MTGESVRWIQQMKRKIASLPSEDQRRTGWTESLMSTHHRMGQTNYHRDEYARVLSVVQPAVPIGSLTRSFFQLAGRKLEPTTLELASWQASAHLIAAANALHSACETMARVALWCCVRGMHSSEIVRNVNLEKIAPQLPKLAQEEMRLLLKMKQLKYLRAFVVVSKQRHLLSPSLDWETSSIAGELKITAFVNDTERPPERHDSKRANDFLVGDIEQIILKLHAIGEALVTKMV